MPQDFYCSQKFWWLSVDLAKTEAYSCCSATPTAIDIDFIKSNPGELFNSPLFVADRKDMLKGIAVKSCSSACWIPESQGSMSRRLAMNSNQVTHMNLNSTPETLNIVVGNNCNMTCVYCNKQYSSSWARDIIDNGNYSVEVAQLNLKDQVLLKISQKELQRTSHMNLLFNELSKISHYESVNQINITGGEPFLFLALSDLISKLNTQNVTVKIWSGLGVDPKRFHRELEKIKSLTNVEIVISSETTGNLYELVRWGNSWKRFNENINILKSLEIEYSFYSVLSNLTLLGINDFLKFAENQKVAYNICNVPTYLAPHVLDRETKESLVLPDSVKQLVGEQLENDARDADQENFKKYIVEFSQRRGIDLASVLPASLLTWIKT